MPNPFIAAGASALENFAAAIEQGPRMTQDDVVAVARAFAAQLHQEAAK